MVERYCNMMTDKKFHIVYLGLQLWRMRKNREKPQYCIGHYFDWFISI